MKRFTIVGIAIVAMLGFAITMGLVNKTALADNTQDEVGTVRVVNDGIMDMDTAVLQDPDGNATGPTFVDEDGDGICDVCGNEPGTGTNRPYGNSRGANNFIDEDGDGICDTCGAAPADGTGNHRGNGSGGSNFVDEDNDGVCDTGGTTLVDGTGSHHGKQGGQGQGQMAHGG